MQGGMTAEDSPQLQASKVAGDWTVVFNPQTAGDCLYMCIDYLLQEQHRSLGVAHLRRCVHHTLEHYLHDCTHILGATVEEWASRLGLSATTYVSATLPAQNARWGNIADVHILATLLDLDVLVRSTNEIKYQNGDVAKLQLLFVGAHYSVFQVEEKKSDVAMGCSPTLSLEPESVTPTARLICLIGGEEHTFDTVIVGGVTAWQQVKNVWKDAWQDGSAGVPKFRVINEQGVEIPAHAIGNFGVYWLRPLMDESSDDHTDIETEDPGWFVADPRCPLAQPDVQGRAFFFNGMHIGNIFAPEYMRIAAVMSACASALCLSGQELRASGILLAEAVVYEDHHSPFVDRIVRSCAHNRLILGGAKARKQKRSLKRKIRITTEKAADITPAHTHPLPRLQEKSQRSNHLIPTWRASPIMMTSMCLRTVIGTLLLVDPIPRRPPRTALPNR
eukprot:2396946-Amphidinium_carterae.1